MGIARESRLTGGLTHTAADAAAGAAASIAMGAIAGAVSGFFWGGIGGRIAMRVLFLTTGDRMRGVTSDDGFEIGRFSADTIFLVIALTVVGAFVGAGYGAFRMLTRVRVIALSVAMALAVGVSAGGSIVKTDGVDFTLLHPLGLAIGLFVFLPAAWAATVVYLTDRLLRSRKLFPQPLAGVDAKPLGRVGEGLAWLALSALAIAGLIDLVSDVRALT